MKTTESEMNMMLYTSKNVKGSPLDTFKLREREGGGAATTDITNYYG